MTSGVYKRTKPVWNKGIKGVFKHSIETREKMRVAQLGEKHHKWKGDEVGYDALHRWVSRMKGKAVKCKRCGKKKTTPKSVQWANKDHKYKRNLKDWISLCAKCHYYYDEKFLKILHGYNRTKK